MGAQPRERTGQMMMDRIVRAVISLDVEESCRGRTPGRTRAHVENVDDESVLWRKHEIPSVVCHILEAIFGLA